MTDTFLAGGNPSHGKGHCMDTARYILFQHVILSSSVFLGLMQVYSTLMFSAGGK